jgi:hypothetical protein
VPCLVCFCLMNTPLIMTLDGDSASDTYLNLTSMLYVAPFVTIAPVSVSNAVKCRFVLDSDAEDYDSNEKHVAFALLKVPAKSKAFYLVERATGQIIQKQDSSRVASTTESSIPSWSAGAQDCQNHVLSACKRGEKGYIFM